MKPFIVALLAASIAIAGPPRDAPPRDALPLDAADLPLNYRLHVEFSAPGGGSVRLGENVSWPLAGGAE